MNYIFIEFFDNCLPKNFRPYEISPSIKPINISKMNPIYWDIKEKFYLGMRIFRGFNREYKSLGSNKYSIRIFIWIDRSFVWKPSRYLRYIYYILIELKLNSYFWNLFLKSWIFRQQFQFPHP